MICPYCSAEIEPIELNGKTFCSNCGLTIKTAAPAQQTSQTIRPISTGIDSVSNIDNENAQTTTVPVQEVPTKLVEPVINDLNTADNADRVVPEKTEEPLSTTENSGILFEQEIREENTLPAESTETGVGKNTETTPEEIFGVQNARENDSIDAAPTIDTSAEIRTLTDNEPISQPDKNLAEAVKNVETLGASGILLDILSDNAVKKKGEQEQEALAAAESLIDKIEITKKTKAKTEKEEMTDNSKPTVQPVKLQNSVKLKINILDDSLVNPITHPEVEAAPEELEIEAPDKDSDGEVEPTLDMVVSDDDTVENEDIHPELPEKKIADAIMTSTDENKNKTSKTEDNDKSEQILSNEEVEKINKNIEDIIPQNNSTDVFSDLPSIKNKKVETPEIIKEAEKELSSEDEKPFVPEEIKSQNKKNLQETPLKDYFKGFIKDDSNKKKKKSKTLKAKKERRKKLLSIIFVMIFLIGAIGLAIFAYSEFLKPAKTVNTIQTLESEDAKLPKDVVVGYALSGEVNFNEENETHTAIYAFPGETERTITYSQTKTDKGKELVSKEIENSKEGYVATTVGQTEYFQISNGSVFWTKNGFLFKLVVKGDTYKELVYKMALSVE